MNTANQTNVNDEISLTNFVRTIRKRIITVFVVAVILFVVLGVMMLGSPVGYMSKAIVAVGHVSNLKSLPTGRDRNYIDRGYADHSYIEDPNELYKRLQAKFSVDRSKKDGLNIIKITTSRPNREKAEQVLKEQLDEILQSHRKVFSSSIEKRRLKLDKLKSIYSSYEKQIEQLETQINKLKNKDARQVSIMVLEKAKLLSQLPILDMQILDIDLSMNEPRSRMTRVIQEPVAKKQLKKRVFMLVVAVFLILTLSVFSAFVHEFIVRLRDELAS